MPHRTTILAAALAFVSLPFVTIVLPAPARRFVLVVWLLVTFGGLARLWGRRGGRFVVFVFSNSPNWLPYVEAELLPRLPESATVLNWSERATWPFWNIGVWAFTLLGGYREFNPLGIVFRRWRWPRVFRFWRAFRDYKHGKTGPLETVRREFLTACGPGPAVALCDERPGGAALRWTGPRARAVALRIFVELVRRLEEEQDVMRLRLDGEVGEPIDVSTIDAFVDAAPALLQRVYADFTFVFRLNDGRPYRVRAFDRGLAGISFDTPEQNEAFWDPMGEVLSECAAQSPHVRVSGAAWYEDATPFR